MIIYIWPDGTWCEAGEVSQFTHRSDDYVRVEVPADVEDIDAWAAEKVKA